MTTLSINAQITKGNWMVGGDVSFSYSKSKPDSSVDSRSFNMDISPNVGYFIGDKLAFGINADYFLSRYYSDSIDSKLEQFRISPFARYYFLDVDKMVNPFLETSYRFSLLKENNGQEFSVKAGLAIFLNSSVAFEASLNYLNSTSKNQFIGSHTILLGFGVQIHLEKY